VKQGVRYIGITSGPINKGKKSLLVGIIFRDNYIEGLLSSTIDVDGTNSTRKIIKMVKRSRFNGQIRILVLNGIALAGLNIIDPDLLEKALGMRVILLNRRRQNAKELISALRKFSRTKKIDVENRITIVKRYASVKPEVVNGLFLQSTVEMSYVKKFAEKWFEAIRISHIIASGISKGESTGRL
jgi:uncharacterized protein